MVLHLNAASYSGPYWEKKVSLCEYHWPLHIYLGMLWGFKVSIIIIDVYGLPIYLGNRPLIGLLNNNMAGMDRPAPMGVDLICNRVRCTSSFVSSQNCDCAFYKFYACLNLAIAMLVIGLCYNLLCVHLPTKLSEHIWCEVHACIWNKFLGGLNSTNIILAALTRS